MATYWHEITHNRQKPGYIRITPMKRKAMELANEFVARHTLPEFYGKLGCGSVPHPEFITNRASTGYNRMVTNYDHIIKQCGLDEAKVLDAVRDNLFNVGYDKQFEGLRNGLKAGGIKRLMARNCLMRTSTNFCVRAVIITRVTWKPSCATLAC